MFGRLLFWILWPAMWFVFPLTRRVRVLIIRGDKVLLVKHFVGPGRWSIPGGGIRFGESLQQAAVREIREELSLGVTKVTPLHSDVIIQKQVGLLMRLHYVSAQIDSGEIQTNWEIAESSWQHKEELKRLVPSDIFQALRTNK